MTIKATLPTYPMCSTTSDQLTRRLLSNKFVVNLTHIQSNLPNLTFQLDYSVCILQEEPGKSIVGVGTIAVSDSNTIVHGYKITCFNPNLSRAN